MNDQLLIKRTKEFVKKALEDAEGGHDWFHTERVYKNAMLIAKDENVDGHIVALSALLHDIADSKFHDGDETIGPAIARKFLFEQNTDSMVIEHVVKIIENMSYKSTLGGDRSFSSKEMEVVQDADRLDAIGAIGIARCFNYGGYKDRKIYDPEIRPKQDQTKEEYKTSEAPTINHFYEKLLLLKDMMNTVTGRRLAEKRHHFMTNFLEQFYDEWNGKA